MKTAARLLPPLAASGLLIAAVAACLTLGLHRRLPGLEPSRVDRSASAYARGDYEEAAALAREHLMRVDRDDTEALRLLARSLSRSGREDSALTLFERRIGRDAMQAEDLYLFGVALDRRGQVDLARDLWADALADDPDHGEALAALVYVHSRAGRHDEARRVAGRLARVPGWEAQGELMLGVAFAESDDPASAADWLARALRRAPPPPGLAASPARYRLLLARSALRVGRPDEAIGPLNALLAEGPSPEASWLLSRAALQRGDEAAALSALRDAGSYRAEHPIEPEPAPFVGEARCVGCHPQIARDAAASRHAKTLHRGEALLALPVPDGPLADPDEPGVEHRIGRRGEALEVESRVDGRSFRAVIEAAFGDPGRYVTMVSRDEAGAHRTLRHSFYRSEAGSGWDRTLGDTGRAHRLDNALGRPVDAKEGVVRCLACHATRVQPGLGHAGPEAADAAIGCERCHGPGGHHEAAVAAGLPDLAIGDPGAAPAAAVTQSCSECHVLDSESEAMPDDRADPAWIRSQGRTLSWSRCFTESGGAIGCVSCHDPHRPAETDPAHYEAVCLSCHSGGRGHPSPSPLAARPPVLCPVGPSRGCISCHMPRVDLPAMHATLTDHYIRVVDGPPVGPDDAPTTPLP